MNLPPPSPRRNWPRRLINTLVALVVVAVAAGAFVLSYAGVHAIALKAGVSPELARLYPGLFDAVLVIACVAAVALRDATWWARAWAWAVIIAVLTSIGATDAAHAMNYSLPHRQTEGVVAAAPAAAVLLAFSLLLTLLRFTRTRGGEDAPSGPAARRAAKRTAAADGGNVSMMAGETPRQPAPALAAPTLAAPTLAAPGQVAPAPAAPALATPAPAAPALATPAPEVPALAAPATAETTGTPGGPADGAAVPEPAAPGATAISEDSPAGEPAGGGSESGAAQSDPAAAAGQDADGAGGPSPAAAPVHQDYWDTDEDQQFAGLVYPAMVTGPGDALDGLADAGEAGSGQPGQQPGSAELDQYAPPFATAPFATVPRLHRARVSPTPPSDDSA